jgi:type IV pilus assembly protein PilB
MINFNNEDKQGKRVDELHLKEAEDLAIMLSQRYGIPYLDLSKTAINTDALRLIPEADARLAEVAAFKISGKNLYIALLTPNNPKLQEILDDLKSKNFVLSLYLVSQSNLELTWNRYAEISASKKADAGVISISDEDIENLISQFRGLGDISKAVKEEERKALEVGGIFGILEIILAGAIATKASDIHIEPEENAVRLRYRLDGVLQDIVDFDYRIHKQILSRIKLISGMKLNVRQNSQDGRFSIKVQGMEMEVRSSILPGAYGESMVLRLLNPKNIEVSFEAMGISDDLYKIFAREIRKPNGMILLTGPTGSGKTTTLYTFLREVNLPGSKIITIEDPIEYHLEGISQTQVNSKANYTFLSGLRSALRQDPDIIMVGEIRDSETAKIAINSALTGHLVFSTLHTNNSAGTIPRLIDLGINPKIISSSLTLSIAQRLIRRLCEKCKKEDVPNESEKEIITNTIATIKKKRPDLVIPDPNKLWRAVGCPQCENIGYKGRIGVFEAIVMDDAISAVAIVNPSEKEIKIAAIPQGILDMRQDGIIKILQGTTSMDELGRVLDLSEEFI